MNSGIPVIRSGHAGNSPMSEAIFQHNIELVSFLIDKGAISWLYSDSEYNLEILELLLSRGAGVNAKTTYGSTALHKACKENNEEINSLLIQKGAHLSVEDKNGKTPLSQLNSDKKN